MFHDRVGSFWRVSCRSGHPHFTSSSNTTRCSLLHHVIGVSLIVASIYGPAKEDTLLIERGRQEFFYFAVIDPPNAATTVVVVVHGAF